MRGPLVVALEARRAASASIGASTATLASDWTATSGVCASAAAVTDETVASACLATFRSLGTGVGSLAEPASGRSFDTNASGGFSPWCRQHVCSGVPGVTRYEATSEATQPTERTRVEVLPSRSSSASSICAHGDSLLEAAVVHCA